MQLKQNKHSLSSKKNDKKEANIKKKKKSNLSFK